MMANYILLQKKYTRIIDEFSRQENISLDKALDFFYHSNTYDLMSHGISDMHCRSDLYLVDELEIEYEKKIKSIY